MSVLFLSLTKLLLILLTISVPPLSIIGRFSASAVGQDEEPHVLQKSNKSTNNDVAYDSVASSAAAAIDNRVILESLFRFPASLLGSEFQPLIDGFDQWIGGTIDEVGLSYAYNATRTKSVQRYYDECYSPPNQDFYTLLEQKRKKIEHSFPNVDDEIVQTNELFWKQQTIHDDVEEDSSSPFRTTRKAFFSSDGRWTWRPAGHFSSRGTKERRKFRFHMMHYVARFLKALVVPTNDGGTYDRKYDDYDLNEWEMEGRSSGLFWYPPGGSVREWHTNRWDIVGHPILEHQPWRMYYIRILNNTTAIKSNDNNIISKKQTGSGMHILYDPSNVQRQQNEESEFSVRLMLDAGAFLLSDKASNDTREDSTSTMRQQQVWRVPDQDGYVTVFRLPNLWHCIVSDTNHRFSLGFAFSEQQVQNILRKANIAFTLKLQRPLSSLEQDALKKKQKDDDEL